MVCRYGSARIRSASTRPAVPPRDPRQRAALLVRRRLTGAHGAPSLPPPSPAVSPLPATGTGGRPRLPGAGLGTTGNVWTLQKLFDAAFFFRGPSRRMICDACLCFFQLWVSFFFSSSHDVHVTRLVSVLGDAAALKVHSTKKEKKKKTGHTKVGDRGRQGRTAQQVSSLSSLVASAFDHP